MTDEESKLVLVDVPSYPKISSIHQEKIEKILSATLSTRLEQVINNATHNQMVLDSYETITTSELLTYLKPIQTALSKIETQIKLMPNNESILLDQHYSAANNLRSNRFDSDIREMQIAVNNFIEKQPRSGKGPSKNYSYTVNLKRIADVIQDEYVETNISDNPNSPFHKLILLWFNDLLNIDVQDVSRHIQTMIKESK